ncbi:MAG: AEC family transporter [Phycisphaerales bacterium]|nr:AEC family transporter [Phycisphaerales bacterium]
MLTHILDILVPIYVTVILGYILGRRGFPWPARPMVPLILQIAVPCLIASHFAKQTSIPPGLFKVMISAAIIVTTLFVLFYILLRLFRIKRRIYLAAASLQNMSVGLALGLLGFGDAGFALALAYASVILVVQFTLGWWIPEERINFKRFFQQVTIYGITIGLVLMFVQIQPPSYVDRLLMLIGNMAIPLLLLSLGFSLAAIKVEKMALAFIMSTIHLVVCLGIGLTVAVLMDLQGDAFIIVILFSILPSSTINILMASEAGVDMPPLTIFVFCTNIWLVITLPVALVLLLPS